MTLKNSILFMTFISSFGYQIQSSGVEPAILAESGLGVEKLEVDLDDDWFEAIDVADLEAIKKFIQLDPEIINIQVSDDGNTALIRAVYNNHPDVVKFLLQAPGIDVNKQNYQGATVLISACGLRDLNMVELLLNAPGIDVNVQDGFGNTALITAVPPFDIENPELASLFAGTPFFSSPDNSRQIIKLLLELPAININAQNKSGLTALAAADSSTNRQIIALIENKIDQLTRRACDAIRNNNITDLKSFMAQLGDTISDGAGITLLDKAFESNKPDIIFFLLSRAQDPRELLSRFPFEFVNPNSDIFKLCMDLAYPSISSTTCTASSTGSVSIETPTQKLSGVLCAVCLAENCTQRCSNCHKVYYCSPKCQAKHWKTHKHECNKIQ